MKRTYRHLLAQSNYRKSLAAAVLNRFGDSIDAIAMSWLAYQVTGSAAFSSLNFMVNFLPSVLFQPFCGAIVERKNHRLIISLCDFARAAVTFAIAVTAIFGNVSAWMILLATFAISTLEAFRQPASVAFIPEFIPKEDIENGVALNNSVSNVVVLIGMGCAGIIIAAVGAPRGILIDASCIAVSGLLIFLIRARKTESVSKEEAFTEVLKEGFRFLFSHTNLKVMAVICMLINMLGTPFMSLQAAICSEMFHKGPALISLMNACYLAGSVVGSFLSPYLRKRVKNSTIFLSMFLMIGAAYLMLVIAPRFDSQPAVLYLLLVLLLFAVGFASGVLNVMLSVLMMEMTEQEYLSRVSSVFSASVMAGQLAAAGVISAILTKVDLYHLFLVVTAASFVICAILFVLPATRSVDTADPKDKEPKPDV